MNELNSLIDFAPYDGTAILVAVLCGGIIGLERQLRGKPVGIRTASLIILGTYFFVATSLMFDENLVDPSRVIGQVITGVGFLGAGVMLSRDGAVMGVTSAATIWVLASIGVMISAGFLITAIKTSILIVLILYGVDLIEDKTASLSRGVHEKVMKLRKKN